METRPMGHITNRRKQHFLLEKKFQAINTFAQIYDYIMKLIKKKYHDLVHLFLLFNYIYPLKGQDCSFEQTWISLTQP